MGIDTPAQSGAALLMLAGLLIVTIAMDARKVTPGSVKIVPWPFLTIAIMILSIFVLRQFLLLTLPV